MRKTPFLLSVPLFLALIMTSVEVLASRIPLGLNSKHGIYMQEMWQGKTPFLCLANRTGQDQVVQVSRWRSRQVPADPLQQWPLAADALRCEDASSLVVEDLLEFKLVGGAWLGLLRPARTPAVESQDASAYSSFQGINGTCNTSGTWIEQPKLRLKSGQPASITLLTTVKDANAVIEFPVETRLNLPHLSLKSASSSSLAITTANQRLTISVGQKTAIPGVHRVQLDIEVPEVTQPTMYLLSGRKSIANNGWQCLVRGMLVEP